MSSYTNRRGPNMSQFIANLNAVDPQPSDELYTHTEDLSDFASANFFDFDMSDPLSAVPGEFDIPNPERKSSTTDWQAPSGTNTGSFMDDFSFGDLSNFNSLPNDSNSGLYSIPNQASQITSPVSATSPTSALTPRIGEKRKAGSVSVDEQARNAAEEDKRRRNTAASARFRVKKKQREQALEKTAREMTEKASMLETKVQQLEMENRWLKGLITDKEPGSTTEGKVGKGALDELFEKFKREERGRSSGEASVESESS